MTASTSPGRAFGNFVERAGRKIPDPVHHLHGFLSAGLHRDHGVWRVPVRDHRRRWRGRAAPDTAQHVQAEHLRWVFDNALLANWLGFGGGVLGVIFVVMLAIGMAENSGMFGALIKKVGAHLPQRILPLVLMFLGILSSMATDAGYLVLIPAGRAALRRARAQPVDRHGGGVCRRVGRIQRQPDSRAG